MPKERIGVTVEIKVNFLAPADGNELVARAKTLQMSGSIGVATVEVATEAQLRVIAIEAGRTLLLEKDAVIASAERANISIVAR